MSRQVELFFNISKSVDMYLNQRGVNANMYMDDMPETIYSSADAVINIKSYVSAALLRAIAQGDASFSIEASIESALEIIHSAVANDISVGISALATATRCIVDSIEARVSVEAKVLESFVSAMAGQIENSVDLSITISNAILVVSSQVDSTITLGSMITDALLKLQAGEVEAGLNVDTSLAETPTVQSMAESLSPCNVEISTSVTETKVVYFRSVEECSAFTIDDLSSMSLEQFYMIEL